MKQRFFIFAAIVLLVGLLVGLNAVSYVQRETTPDDETNPNRSTYNTGVTGTRAFYDLLAETGRSVARWEEPVAALRRADLKNKPQTFVVVGTTRRPFADDEIVELLRWVSEGGRLVVIDRAPPAELIKTTANWNIAFDSADAPPFFDFDAADQQQMTEKTAAARAVQPTVLTRRVNAAQPSRFASAIRFQPLAGNADAPPEASKSASAAAPVRKNFYQTKPPPSPPPAAPFGVGSGDSRNANRADGIQTEIETEAEPDETALAETPALLAPVAHLANQDKTLLVDFPFGSGTIVFLSDPYFVSNGGIGLVDNAQLAINVVTNGDAGGLTAFDEFHQGYGAGENRLFGYFEGTPLVAVLWQTAALLGLFFLAQSRRFGRALPANEASRLSKLEYVRAMAELQQRTRAFDLALENIYTDFRRRAARLVGADHGVARADLARLLAERARVSAADVENLLFKCEDIIHGEPTNKKEVLHLTTRLRELEERLNLRRSRRQTFGK